MIREVVHLGKHYAPDFGGIETATQNLAETAREIGLPVTCYASATHAAQGKTYWLNGVKVRRLWTFGKVLSTPISPGFLAAAFRRRALVHVHLPNPLAELAALAGALLGGGSILAPYFHALPFRGQGIGALWFRAVTRPLLKRARVILISNPALREVFPELGEFSQKVRVLPFVTEIDTAPVRAREKIVLGLGRLVPYKGYEDLLAAWARSEAAERGFRLVLVGDGPLGGELRALAQRLQIGAQVEFISRCSEAEKSAWFRRATAFVMPSRDESETFGIAALEAMAHGLPLLATDIPTGLATLARGGKCGGRARAKDVASLAEELDRLLSLAPTRLAEIGEENRAFAAEHFSRRALRQSYESLMTDLAA